MILTSLQMISGKMFFKRITLITFFCVVLSFLAFFWSLTKGGSDISMSTVYEALMRFDPAVHDHLIVRDIRLPRAFACTLVGSAFSVAGAIMQGVTRNPLADSGLLGINAGAACALAVCYAFWPGLSFAAIILFSFLGAFISALLVQGIAYRPHSSSGAMRFVLAGAAVSAMLIALSKGIAIYFNVSQGLMFWSAGGVAGATWKEIHIITPWIVLSLLASLLLGRSISVLNMGDSIASSLGLPVKQVYLFAGLIVIVLAGTSVAVVGSVGFVGLVIPHVSRFLVGSDYKKIIPLSLVAGALFMLMADTFARMLNPPFETPIGVLTALVGFPLFMYLARKEGTRR